jgi:hypothetical protein
VFIAQNFYQPQPETGRMDGGLSLLMLGNGDGTLRPVLPRESGMALAGDPRAAVAADWNGDAWPDLVVAQNHGPLVVFEQASESEQTSEAAARLLRVRLRGLRGNRGAIGACVTLLHADGSSQTRELAAGEGYLSQRAPSLVFGSAAQRPVQSVRVRWPNGAVSEQQVEAGATELIVDQPDR